MFKEYNRNTSYLLPPSVDEWLPLDHLARFVVEVVDRLDISTIACAYSYRGEKAYNPSVLLGLLFYGYATGTFSSRKIEEKTYTCIDFRYIAANQHPDHDTIASFRKRFLPELNSLFLQILVIAHEMGISKIGKVSLDGTKMKANASKHSALSWGHAEKLEKQLKSEIDSLMKKAQEVDDIDEDTGMSIPEELSIRKNRLQKIEEAKRKINERAEERYKAEKEEYDDKIKKREEKEKKTGKKTGGKPPKPPTSGPLAKDQINLTDEESRIMPKSGKGFEQCYNGQASVDIETMLIVGKHITNAANDKKEIDRAIEELKKLPEGVAGIEDMMADTGFFSKKNIETCLKNNINPLIAQKRDKHHQSPEERFKEPPPIKEDATEVEKAIHRLKTQEGKKLYAKRKSTVEPVFGIIKNIMGFRQFMLRGLESVSGEWDLVSIAWNLKRLHKMKGINGLKAIAWG
jgi:transposase